jgi:hypothetical protein
LKKLSKHKDQNISKQADRLLDKWKKIAELTKKIEDKKTIQTNTKTERKVSTENHIKSPLKSNPKVFQELCKKVSIGLNLPNQPSIRNTVRKIFFDALVNREETSSNI